MFRSREIDERLARLEERLGGIETALGELRRGDDLRRQLERERERLDALARQSLHVVQLLDEARQEIARLRADRES